jgi:serine-type D-Ala-D-Ala carboxypeptidase (penicillin-binding protein 5/6)
MDIKRKIGIALFSLFAFSQTNAAPPIPIKAEPPDVAAEAYVLVDYLSGKSLAEKDADKRIDPASLTKMMSVYVLDHELQSGKITLNDEVPISEQAWKAEGSRMFVEVGNKIPLKDLLNGVIIQSGNDATIALAEYVAGTEATFVNLMNQYAKKLGMQNTHFANATGIPDPNHYTSARDLSILARAIIREFPKTYKIYSEKWFTFNNIKQPNRNRLLWREPYVDGIKTGHSSTAGYCLAASGEKDGMRLISVILGSKTDNERTEQTLQLLRFGFRFYETKRLFAGNTSVNEPRVWMGAAKKVRLGLKQDLYITLPQGQYANLEAKMNINKQITAPIKKGEQQGKLVVMLGDTQIAEAPLLAMDEVKAGSMWERLSDYLNLSVNKMLSGKDAAAQKS